MTAPTTPGVYHLNFAFEWELTGDQVASGTNWAVGHDVWGDGNDIATFSQSQVQEGQQNGYTEDQWLYTTGYAHQYVPMDALTIDVSQGTAVPSAAITPLTGTQSGNVSISYTLTDANSDNCSITAEYSIDGGATWNPATASGGDGTTGLNSNPEGTTHEYIWASKTDIPLQPNSNVEFSITPTDEVSGHQGNSATIPFTIENTAYLTPPLVRQAYGFNLLSYNGAGERIAIVDPCTDPNLTNDVEQFDSTFGFPMSVVNGAPTTKPSSNILVPTLYIDALPGSQPPQFESTDPSEGDVWEETLSDVEWAHAIAPMADIVLVEALRAQIPIIRN